MLSVWKPHFLSKTFWQEILNLLQSVPYSMSTGIEIEVSLNSTEQSLNWYKLGQLFWTALIYTILESACMTLLPELGTVQCEEGRHSLALRKYTRLYF